MEAILKSEFAKRLHVSKARVSQMVAQGMPVTADGKVDVPAALNWIEQHVDLSHGRHNPTAATMPPSPAPAAQPPAPMLQAGADRLPDPGRILLTAKAKRALVELRRAERQERKETGELVEAADVQRAVENLFAVVKSRILAAGHRLGPRVAAEPDAAKCASIIDDYLREALEELAGYQVAA